MMVAAEDFTLTVSWVRFSAYSPSSDFQQTDPHYTQVVAKSSAAGRKLYKMLKANPEALKSVSWARFTDWLKQNDIAYAMNFSQWS